MQSISFIKLRQKLDVNRLSLSETITAGMPNWHTHCSKNRDAIRGASALPVMGMKRTYLLKRSTIVNMPSYPEDTGKCVLKSIETDSKHVWGTGKGCNSPAGL